MGNLPVSRHAGYGHDEWEIDRRELEISEIWGSGAFGVVRSGTWPSSMNVAMEMLNEGTMYADAFDETEIMILQHLNLVNLNGVCTRRPIDIVTEVMQNGSLLSYLHRNETSLGVKLGWLLSIFIQITNSMVLSTLSRPRTCSFCIRLIREIESKRWWVGDISRERAESLLEQEDKEGCFVVRTSTTKEFYSLSLYTKVPYARVEHYSIKQNTRGQVYLKEQHRYNSIPELVNYHRHNSGGLVTRLQTSPGEPPVPSIAGRSYEEWEIDHSDLQLLEVLGSGSFGIVRKGKWHRFFDVAVKMINQDAMSEDEFIAEAKVMTHLQHPYLVQLYGICTQKPIYIVTEYMPHGSLLSYLHRNEASLRVDDHRLLNMCIQVCEGMEYLETQNYIHRDLAARNCLVGFDYVIKISDFGLARYTHGLYVGNEPCTFPIRWVPPEVFKSNQFSSKSDVWAYGVLMWEVFTYGKVPYTGLENNEVVDGVQRGLVLEKPKACFKKVYDVMRDCWSYSPNARPSFRQLKERLINISQSSLYH